MFGSLEKSFSLDMNPEHCTYVDSINRVSLMFPSNLLFNIIYMYCDVVHFQFVYFKRVGIQIYCVRISKIHSYWHHETLYCKQ